MPYSDFSPLLKKLRDSSFDGAMVSGLNEILIINQQRDYNFTFKFCKERVMGISIVLYFRQNYFLVPAVNEVIRNLISAGLIEHWHYKYIDKKLLAQNLEASGPQVMTVNHLAGCFQLLTVGCLLASLCFGVEWFWHCFLRDTISNKIILPYVN